MSVRLQRLRPDCNPILTLDAQPLYYIMTKRHNRNATVAIMNKAGIEPARDRQCERCGKPACDRHHEDYSKPTEVIFLCRKCHKRRHKELGWGTAELAVSDYMAMIGAKGGAAGKGTKLRSRLNKRAAKIRWAKHREIERSFKSILAVHRLAK